MPGTSNPDNTPVITNLSTRKLWNILLASMCVEHPQQLSCKRPRRLKVHWQQACIYVQFRKLFPGHWAIQMLFSNDPSFLETLWVSSPGVCLCKPLPGFHSWLGIPLGLYSLILCVNEFSEGRDSTQRPGGHSLSFTWLCLSRVLFSYMIFHFNSQEPIVISYW